MTKSNFFTEAFQLGGEAIAEMRHTLLGGFFGRTFEPHPMSSPGQAEHDRAQEAQGPSHDLGIDR